jgi:hypothetical protein
VPRDFLHNHPQFADLIRIVAEEKRIDPALVEKDYWIMEWTHDWLAGAPGLEPGNGGIKIRCLTTWLRPIAACGAVMTARLAQVRSRGRTILVGPDWINAASVSKLTFLACGLE